MFRRTLQKYKKILKPARFYRKIFIFAPQTLKMIENNFGSPIT